MSGRGISRFAFAFAITMLLCSFAIDTRADDAASTSMQSSDKATASLESHHHYASPAERANDAMLTTQVKSALADSGIAADSPIVVDCDHGKILLIGVLKSSDDAKRAGQIAANTPGVRAVDNRLTWH